MVHQGIPEHFPPVLEMWPSDYTYRPGSLLDELLISQVLIGWRVPNNAEWKDVYWQWGVGSQIDQQIKPLLPVVNFHGAYGLTANEILLGYWGFGELFVTAKINQLYRWHDSPLGGDAWLGMYVFGSVNKYETSGDYSWLNSFTYVRQNGTHDAYLCKGCI